MKTVPFRGETERITKKMWPPAMQQHPGASVRFHCMARRTESPNDVTTSYATASRCISTVPLYGETDRITKWCDHQLCNSHPGASLRFHFVTDRITTCRYKILRPVSHPPNVHSFVGTARTNGAVPPALFKKGGEGRKKKEVLPPPSIQMLHTHTRQSRGNPERQEEEKSGHTTGRRPKTAQGGRGTDGPPEPTYTAKRTWQNQSTHLNPTTQYGETSRRVIRDQWGLVGEKRKQQNSGLQTGLQSPKYLGFVRCSLSGTVVKSCPNWHKRLSSSIELGAQHVSPHQKPKWPHLQEDDMPVAFCRTCHVELQKLKLQW